MRGIAAIFALILLYSLLAGSGLLPDPPFARPTQILHFIFSRESLPLLFQDSLATLLIAAFSWFLGGLAGVAVGILVALVFRGSSIVLGILEFLRSVPSVMWIPFAIVLAGLGTVPALSVACLSVFLFMGSEVAYSGHLFPMARRVHLQRLGLSLWDRIRYAHIYEIMAVVIPSGRVAATISLVVVVIAEMSAGARVGLGARLLLFQAAQRSEAMLAVVLLTGAIGLAINRGMEWLECRLVPWHRAESNS